MHFVISCFSTGGQTRRTSCQYCVNGYYGSGETCTACPVDTKSDMWTGEVATEADCQACPSGFSTGGATGQTTCQSCIAGFYGNGETCTPCPEDTFVSSWNSEVSTEGQCQACRSGYSTNGATGAAECHCKFTSVSNVLERGGLLVTRLLTESSAYQPWPSIMVYPIEQLITWTVETHVDWCVSTLQVVNCSMGHHHRLSGFICRAQNQPPRYNYKEYMANRTDVFIWHHYQNWEALIGNDRHWVMINIGRYFRSVLEFWSALFGIDLHWAMIEGVLWSIKGQHVIGTKHDKKSFTISVNEESIAVFPGDKPPYFTYSVDGATYRVSEI